MANESTIQPFVAGDIFVGATVLDNPKDDHAGPGRIIQYDSDWNEKGVLWTEGTTHLVGGLKFGPDGNLWAFDSQAFKVLRISPEGNQLPEIEFAPRSFSHCNFASDGTVLMGEHLVGDGSTFPEWMGKFEEMGTFFQNIPGEEVFGHGHIFRFTLDGELVKEYNTEVHGGMTGFLGVTTASLSPDEKTIMYSSETGTRLMRYDLENDKQLEDFVTFAPREGMVLIAMYRPDGSVLMIKAVSREEFVLEHLSAEGESLRVYELPGPGWATMVPSLDDNTILISNFFAGDVGTLNLDTGELDVKANVGVARSLAGIAQYPG